MRRLILTLALLAAAPATLHAQTPANVSVTAPWARATAASAMNGAAYATLSASGTADTLTGASTPVAGMVELHQTIQANGVMQMRPTGPLAIEPGKPLVLSPGGYHVMLMHLKQPLKQGESFPITFTFAHAAPVTVQAKIAGPGATAP